MTVLLRLAAVGVAAGAPASLAAWQEIYEDFVAQATENRSSPLMEISEHLLVFTVWNIASTTALSVLKRGYCACKEGEGHNLSVCSIFPDSLLLAAPLLMAEGGGGPVSLGTESASPGLAASDLTRRALDLIALVRQALIVQGNSVVGAAVAYAMDLVYTALWKPEFGMSWFTGGGAPRLLLPHCSALDFVDAMPWEGVSRPSKPMHWLEPVLQKLPLKSFLNVALRARASEDDCSRPADTFGTFQDPSCGLGHLSETWETLTLFWDTSSCVGQSSCLSGGTFRPRRQSVQGTRELNAEEVESMVLDRSVDVLTLSPSAGNCVELQRFLATVLQTALPQVLALPINALLAPPRRAAPDFLKAGKRLRETSDSFQLGRHCSLQSAIDFLPQFVLLFVDGLRAVFVSRAVRHHFGHDVNAEARSLWRRGVSCPLPVVELLERAEGGPVSPEAAALGSAAWPCEALRLPQLAKGSLPRVKNQDLYPETEARCVALAGPTESVRSAFLGATLPMTPGRAQLMSGRGRCFLEENFCECFPPWRDALCDRQDLPDGNGGSIIATRLLPGGEDELEQNLLNWWESFNNQMDHPVLIFHEGLETDAALRLRAASPTRVWFSHLGPLFSSQRVGDGEAGCRFKFAWLSDEDAMEDYDWLLWIDSDVTFPIPLDRDVLRETATAGAILGFLPEERPLRMPRALRTLALLFRQSEEMRGPGDLSEGGTDLSLSSRLLVMHLPSFRSPGPLKRFASWALEFSQQVPICRWGDAALRSMQAWLIPPEKRLALQKLQLLRPNT